MAGWCAVPVSVIAVTTAPSDSSKRSKHSICARGCVAPQARSGRQPRLCAAGFLGPTPTAALRRRLEAAASLPEAARRLQHSGTSEMQVRQARRLPLQAAACLRSSLRRPRGAGGFWRAPGRPPWPIRILYVTIPETRTFAPTARPSSLGWRGRRSPSSKAAARSAARRGGGGAGRSGGEARMSV